MTGATTTFWDRRRAAVRAEADAEARAEDEARMGEVHAELADKDDETILQEMGLPDPETLKAGDDFAAFMAKEVPSHLRHRALRKLWRSNPVLACVDGLNEYDDDYRAAMLAGGPIKTAYQVGKGMLSHLEEMARQEEQAASGEETLAVEVDLDASVEDVEPDEVVEAAAEVSPAVAMDVEGPAEPAPRRMRFHFEEAGT